MVLARPADSSFPLFPVDAHVRVGGERGQAPVCDEGDGESDYTHHRPRLRTGRYTNAAAGEEGAVGVEGRSHTRGNRQPGGSGGLSSWVKSRRLLTERAIIGDYLPRVYSET